MTRYTLARRVNSEINLGVGYITDAEQFGVPEAWCVALRGMGDCEDYALGKFVRLTEEGVPLEALRLAVVFTETAEGATRAAAKQSGDPAAMGDHAVLVVRCEDGDYILDNRFPDLVESLSSVNYKLDRMWNWERNRWEHGA